MVPGHWAGAYIVQPSGSLSLARIASLALPAAVLCTVYLPSPANSLCPPPAQRGFPALAVSYHSSLLFSSAPWCPNTASLPPLARWSTASITSGMTARQTANARLISTAAVPPARTPAIPRSPIADDGAALQLTVERLVERSLQGLEDHLRRTWQPATTVSAADNISLPSPAHGRAAASDAQPALRPPEEAPPPLRLPRQPSLYSSCRYLTRSNSV